MNTMVVVLTFVVQNEDLVRAKNISNLKLRF